MGQPECGQDFPGRSGLDRPSMEGDRTWADLLRQLGASLLLITCLVVALLPRRFPDLVNDNQEILESSFLVPTECLGEVAANVRDAGPA
jgi:hypothetical protein